MSSAFEYLLVDETDAVVQVTVNRPQKRNPLSPAVLAELKRCFEDLHGRQDLLAVGLRGAGDRCFAAGGDLHAVGAIRAPDAVRQMALDAAAALDAIRDCPVPVFAFLNGDAIGGGAELALACDVRIAASGSRIALAQAALNISPAWGGGGDLLRALGSAHALHLLAGAGFVDADQALTMGLVQAVCPAEEDFEAFCARYLEPIRTRRPQVMRALKALAVAHREGATPAAVRELEIARLCETWCHADHWTAHDAVLKRIR